MDCIRTLCDEIDEDFDDRVTAEEIRGYIHKK